MAMLLELEAVSKAFGQVVVADSVTFEVAAGETIGIVGPNGAGKTSLLNLISGNLSADAGRIRLDGRDVTAIRRMSVPASASGARTRSRCRSAA